MTIRCPKCLHKFNLLEASADGDWRAIINLLPVFGPSSQLVFEYCELFGVTPLQVKAKKLLRLLDWMARLFKHKKFKFQKREYAISETGLREALAVVCNRHFETPLTEHNYLKKVMIGIAEKERKEARDRADREQKKREARKMAHGARSMEHGGEISAAEFKAGRRIESLASGIGREIEDKEKGEQGNGRKDS